MSAKARFGAVEFRWEVGPLSRWPIAADHNRAGNFYIAQPIIEVWLWKSKTKLLTIRDGYTFDGASVPTELAFVGSVILSAITLAIAFLFGPLWGGITLLASLLAVRWLYSLGPTGVGLMAPLVHDWVCDFPEQMPRAIGDELFYEVAVNTIGVSRLRAYVYYRGVRLRTQRKRLMQRYGSARTPHSSAGRGMG